MKIAIVCPYDFFSPGGVQTHIRDSAAELRKHGHEVIVIAPHISASTPSLQDIVLIGKGKKISFNETTFDVSYIDKNGIAILKRLLTTEKFDIIHFHTVWTPILPIQVLYRSDSVNICTFHDTPPNTIAGRLTRFFFRLIGRIIFKRLDVIIAVSEAPARHLVKLPGKQIHIVPPCFNLSRFSPRVRTLVTPSAALTILFLGRLEQRKGITTLLEAYKKLVADHPGIRLLIAGTGTEAGRIQEYARLNNLNRIHYLGHISENDKPACFASCDIFCSPATHGESFGIVLVEAMASGKPVVACANQGYSLLLDEKKEFCLARPADPDDLYRKLKKLVENKPLRDELSTWGLEYAAGFDCKRVIPGIVGIYEKALNDHSGA